MDIDWLSEESHLLLNPRMPKDEIVELNRYSWDSRPGHIWLPTSGTSRVGCIKVVGLAKESILKSAQSVNRHLAVEAEDIWLNSLPSFHIGGLAIFARAFLAKNRVIKSEFVRWEVRNFIDELQSSKASLTALVPTQIFDIVNSSSQSPETLRAVVVGGGALDPELYQAARKLGWPILPSYGMTEMSSQIATASLSSLAEDCFPAIYPLKHVEVSLVKGELLVRGLSRFSEIILIEKGQRKHIKIAPKGWFSTGDFGELASDGSLKVFGRGEEIKKVGGELVSLIAINGTLEQVLMEAEELAGAYLFFSKTSRLGYQVDIVVEKEMIHFRKKLLKILNEKLHPYERPRNLYVVEKLPRTALGKIRRAELLGNLAF